MTSLSNFVKKVIVLLLFSMLIQVYAYADYVTTGSLNGVYFKLYHYTYADDVAKVIAPPDGTKYVGAISVDERVTISYNTYEVRGFESGAFIGQDEMISLRCPIVYETTPSPSEFEGCTKLESLNLYNPNNYSTYITYEGALYEKKSTNFKPITTYYELVICPPAISLLNVYNSTYDVIVSPRSFVSSNNLTTIKLSKTAKVSVGWGEFINFERFDASVSQNYISSNGVLYTNDKKKLLAMPGKPRSEYRTLSEASIIGNSSFASCHIENLYLNDKSFTIYPFAFSNFSGNLYLSGLSTLTKESDAYYIGGVKYFDNFEGNLFLEGEVSQNLAQYLGDLNENATIYCEGKYIDLIRKYWAGNIESTTPCWISERETGYTTVSFSLDSNIESLLESAEVYFNGTKLNPINGRYQIKDLVPDSKYDIEIQYPNTEGNTTVVTDYIETLSVLGRVSLKVLSSTQTSAICELIVPKEILNLGLKGGVYSTNPSGISNLDENCDNEPIITIKELDEGSVIKYNNYNQGIIKIEINGLTPDITHKFTPIIINSNNQVKYDGYYQNYSTASLNLSINYSELTQRSFKISSIHNSGALNCSDWVIKARINSGELIPIEGYSMNYLYPETEYYIPLYFEKGNVKFISGIRVKTASINFNVSITDITPTTAKISARYNSGNAVEYIDNIEFTISNNSYKNNTVLSGLKPNTTYSVYMTVLMEFENKDGSKSSKTYTASKNFDTKELLLYTLPPNCVNSTTANVKAETNIADQETGAGFEWKKYDAPSSLSPNQGYGYVYDGVLEGQIKNLQPTSYYNVRAFYKDAAGNYTYSDWVTFDPSDFSYFEPTVHTYPTNEVSASSATVKGYVLPGSDEILKQGIEYWKAGAANAPMKVMSSMAANAKDTVFATGQVMIVTLNNLKPSTDYCYRAFVTTQAGTTYGEEQTFTTGYGVGDVNADGVVNVSDVTALVNKILQSADTFESVCDVNADGVVNVSDVTALVNIILNNSSAAKKHAIEAGFKSAEPIVPATSVEASAIQAL